MRKAIEISKKLRSKSPYRAIEIASLIKIFLHNTLRVVWIKMLLIESRKMSDRYSKLSGVIE